MPINTMKLIVSLVLMLFVALPAVSGEWTLVKTSTHDQRAIVRDHEENLVLIKVGDRIMDDWEVIGIKDKKIFLQKITLDGKMLKTLEIAKREASEE